MDLAALKMFLAVAQERSFSRAAAKVHRTQPAVSQAVRRLESDLGEQLFDRSSKSGTLTEAGRMLENYGQRIVRLAEETESAVRARAPAGRAARHSAEDGDLAPEPRRDQARRGARARRRPPAAALRDHRNRKRPARRRSRRRRLSEAAGDARRPAGVSVPCGG